MGGKIVLLLTLTATFLIADADRCYRSWSSSYGNQIANKADSYTDDTKWSKASRHRTGRNTNKCNIFVAEVIEEVGASVPHRHSWKWSPIGAGEWLKTDSSYLTSADCWSLVTGCYKKGDVIAEGGHVAIVTGEGTTTSAAKYKIVKNDWGFREGLNVNPTFWRYTC